jgi:hypothetical protein
MLEKGFLASNRFYATYAHKDIHVEKYLHAVGETFSFIKVAAQRKEVEKHLKGPVAKPGFYRLA